MNRTGSENDFPDLGVDHPRKLGWLKPSVWKVLFSGPSTVYTIPAPEVKTMEKVVEKQNHFMWLPLYSLWLIEKAVSFIYNIYI